MNYDMIDFKANILLSSSKGRSLNFGGMTDKTTTGLKHVNF